ncbi:hypothetical protein O5D80_002026 [Batrachochytrium dendrobatidis]|nr:hypothetical protein O5D80_002026 [Batrachochytrium dendrobatidis]
MITLSQLYYVYAAVSLLTIVFGCSIAINCRQVLSAPLLLLSRHRYRTEMRKCQGLFGSLILYVTFFYAPLDIILTGDHDGLTSEKSVVIMANHQIYTDWWYIWIICWFRNAHCNLKIMLKASLRFLPILGWGMAFFEFLFMARKWSKDKPTLQFNLTRAKNDKLPIWLLIFPEGTVITDDTRSKSQAYAKKADISDNPDNVLIPRSTGLYNSLLLLQPDVEYLYDFTIGYSGLAEHDCPYDMYPTTKVFFEGRGPKQIHVHVDKFKIVTLPGFAIAEGAESETKAVEGNPMDGDTNPEFSLWLRKRFLEKDELLRQFYKHGSFPEQSHEGIGKREVMSVA